jgi:hypothetical protein
MTCVAPSAFRAPEFLAEGDDHDSPDTHELGESDTEFTDVGAVIYCQDGCGAALNVLASSLVLVSVSILTLANGAGAGKPKPPVGWKRAAKEVTEVSYATKKLDGLL